jgi:hypothetical protein
MPKAFLSLPSPSQSDRDCCQFEGHRLEVCCKQVVTPAGATPWIPAPTRVDSTLVKAIVRAHRWRDMLESGDYATVRDLAKAEAIDESYLGRVLRLTLLSPTLIDAILEGRQPANLELDDLLQQFPIEWDRQLGSLTEG